MSGQDAGFGRDDLDRLARRAVDAVLRLVARATSLALGVLVFTLVCSLGGFALGIAALSGGIETVWIVLGGGFAVLAIGAVVTAILRLQAVRRVATSLFTEVRALIGGNERSERVVIETVESADGAEDGGLVLMSRQFFTMREEIDGRVDQFRSLATTLTAVTSFPGLVALAVLVSFVFAGLGVLFLIALAL